MVVLNGLTSFLEVVVVADDYDAFFASRNGSVNVLPENRLNEKFYNCNRLIYKFNLRQHDAQHNEIQHIGTRCFDKCE